MDVQGLKRGVIFAISLLGDKPARLEHGISEHRTSNAEHRTSNEFGRAFGTWGFWTSVPALKRRAAIFGCPSGTTTTRGEDGNLCGIFGAGRRMPSLHV